MGRYLPWRNRSGIGGWNNLLCRPERHRPRLRGLHRGNRRGNYNGKNSDNLFHKTTEYSIVKIGFPIVVKECYGSYGQQVYLANDKKELINVIDKLGTRQFILQEFISTSYGKDIRIEVIGNNIIAIAFFVPPIFGH